MIFWTEPGSALFILLATPILVLTVLGVGLAVNELLWLIWRLMGVRRSRRG